MFPLEFPFRALSRANPRDWILDPFCGRGTTNFAARLHGLRSVGVDSNPVAAAVAQAKLVAASPLDISNLCQELLRTKSVFQVPSGPFWTTAFHPQTLKDICKLRSRLLKSSSTPEEITLRAIILGILHGPRTKGLPTYLSNQMPRTYATKPVAAVRYWRKHKLTPHHVDVMDAVYRRAQFSLSETPRAADGTVLRADSRDLGRVLDGYRFNWVVTSPPYYGMRSYIPDQWLRNWFLGGPSEVDYTQVGQLSHKGRDVFISDLATVWRSAAKVCAKRSNLVIRFGALPSAETDPASIIKSSIAQADVGWRIRAIKNAGLASAGRRQADQFMRSTSKPIHEIDVYARLES